MGSPHPSRNRRRRALVFHATGLILTLALALGQFGLSAAGATDRSRSGSFSSDTDVISTDRDADDGSTAEADADPSDALVPTRADKQPSPKVVGVLDGTTICHATSSPQQPYLQQTPDASGVDGIQPPNGDHFLNHTGPVFDAAIHGAGGGWGDIIPPTDDDGDPLPHAGLNWTPQGQAIWAAGCVVSSSMNVTKAVTTNPSPLTPGGTVTFTITVANTGTNSLANVTVTDTLPAGLVPQTATFNGNPCVSGIAGQTVTCQVGTIAFGASAVVTITALETGAPTTCSYQNTASAASRTATGALVTSDSSNTVTVNVTNCLPPGTPDMSVLKSATATVSPGGQITYTIVAENLGNAAESNVSISDPLPAGTTFVSATASAGWAITSPAVGANGTVTFTKASVAAGESATFTIVVNVDAAVTCGATISNTSTVAPGGSNAANDSSTDTTTVLCANITVAKDATATVIQGGQITYTIDVANTGTGPASGVSISDPLPAGTTFVSATASAGWAITSPAVGANGTVTFTKASVAAGESAQFTIVVNVDANATCGSVITNTATGSTTSVETSTADNSGTDTTTVVCASVTLTKSGPTSVPQGGQITYTLTVTNNGQTDATGVQITDDLDNSLTNVQATATQGTCSVGGGNLVSCTIGTLAAAPPPTSATITITANAPTTGCPVILNQATGTYGPANTPIASGTIQTQVTGAACSPQPGLSITKTAGAAVVQPGDPVSFSVTVTSTGNAAADNVVMTDTLPTIPGTTWSITGGNGAGSCSIGAGNALTCNYGSMSPGISLTVTVSTTPTTSASCGNYVNTATVNATNIAPVTSSASVAVDCPAGPSGVNLTKDGPATAKVGDTITYTFTATLAAGSPNLSGFTFSDPVCDPGTIAGPTGDDGDGVLETGETWGFSCTHVVTASDPDPLPNTATFCATDPSGATVCDSDNHQVDIAHPGIEVVKEADPTSGSPGDVITYTFTVTNSGDVPLTNVSVDDDVLGHICDIPLLPPNTTVVCTGTYTIPDDASGTITNIVIAGGTDPEGDPVEDQDDFTITIVAGTTVTKSPPGGLAFTGAATAIPFASLALLLLTAGSGLVWLGRRRGRSEPDGPEA